MPESFTEPTVISKAEMGIMRGITSRDGDLELRKRYVKGVKYLRVILESLDVRNKKAD